MGGRKENKNAGQLKSICIHCIRKYIVEWINWISKSVIYYAYQSASVYVVVLFILETVLAEMIDRVVLLTATVVFSTVILPVMSGVII